MLINNNKRGYSRMTHRKYDTGIKELSIAAS